jgi:hypothetical protein
MKKFMVVLSIAVISTLMTGCGMYNMQSTLPTHISTIAVPIFSNTTDQFNIEQYATQKTIDEFIATGKVSITDEYKADAVVKCSLVKYIKEPILFDTNQIPQQYRMRVYILMTFFDNKNQTKLWDEKNIYEETTYYVLNNLGMPAEDENIARNRVLDQISKRIISRVIYGI